MDIQDLLERKVDIVTEKSLHNPRIRKQILSKAVPL